MRRRVFPRPADDAPSRTLDSYLHETEYGAEMIMEDPLVEIAVHHYLTEQMGESIVPMLDIIQTDNLVFLVMVSPACDPLH